MFPSANIKTTNYELTPELETLLERKLAPLEKFLPENESDICCDVELERITGRQSGRIFRAEVNLKVGGNIVRAEATKEQMEQAIDAVRDEVKRALRRQSKKRHSLVRQGGKAIKDLLRFGG